MTTNNFYSKLSHMHCATNDECLVRMTKGETYLLEIRCSLDSMIESTRQHLLRKRNERRWFIQSPVLMSPEQKEYMTPDVLTRRCTTFLTIYNTVHTGA